MKSRAQEVLERQKAILAARPDRLKAPESTQELWEAIEQDTAEAEKRTHGPYDIVVAYPAKLGNAPLGEFRNCYVVEVPE